MTHKQAQVLVSSREEAVANLVARTTSPREPRPIDQRMLDALRASAYRGRTAPPHHSTFVQMEWDIETAQRVIDHLADNGVVLRDAIEPSA